MKDEIIKISQNLVQGVITEMEAQTLLLGLFAVSKSLQPEFKPVYDFLWGMGELEKKGLLPLFLYESKEQISEIKSLLYSVKKLIIWKLENLTKI